MSIISEIKKALKIAKKVKEIKNYFDKNIITDETHKDLADLKAIFDRMGNRVEAFKGLWDIIFSNDKK